MPIGDQSYIVASSSITRTIIRLFGVVDLHSHLRIRPLVQYISSNADYFENANVLEIGCGGGLNLFELAKRTNAHCTGYDFNCEAIARAQRISELTFDNRLQFHCEDATAVTENRTFDCIMFIDFLEHITRPEQLLDIFDKRLAPGGKLIISVPTTMYPKIFGPRFHRDVGHVMDGYTLSLLRTQLPPHYNLVHSSYNTGAIGGLGCFIYYRLVNRIRFRLVRYVLEVALQVFRHFDFINNQYISSSLFAVFAKTYPSPSLRCVSGQKFSEAARDAGAVEPANPNPARTGHASRNR